MSYTVSPFFLWTLDAFTSEKEQLPFVITSKAPKTSNPYTTLTFLLRSFITLDLFAFSTCVTHCVYWFKKGFNIEYLFDTELYLETSLAIQLCD